MLREQKFYFHSYGTELFVKIKNIIFLQKIKKAIYERIEKIFKKNHKKHQLEVWDEQGLYY